MGKLTINGQRVYIYIITGWWYTYPSEKYEFVNGKDDIPHIMENKKCLKPPTRS
jgi:hypothetical protein